MHLRSEFRSDSSVQTICLVATVSTLALTLLMVFQPTSAFGDALANDRSGDLSVLCSPVCEATIRPGVVEAEIPLAGWAFPEGDHRTVTLVDPPLFGTWENETYTPGPDFWVAGVDRIRLRQGSSAITTLVLRLAAMNNLSAYSEDFEDSGGVISTVDIPWMPLTSLGTLGLSSSTTIAGQWSLKIDLSPSQNQYVVDDTTSPDERHEEADMAYNTNTPDPDLQNTNANPPFQATLLTLSRAGADLRLDGALEVRAWAGEGCQGTCVTPWRQIEANKDYHVTLTEGPSVLEQPELGHTLTLVVEALDGSEAFADEITGIDPPPSNTPNQYSGPSIVWGTPNADLLVDDLGYHSAELVVPGDLRREEFDGGWDQAWTTTGALTVYKDPAASDFRGVVPFFNPPTSGYIAGWTDPNLGSSGEVFAHARFDTSDLMLPDNARFQVFSGLDSAGFSQFSVALDFAADGTVSASAKFRRENNTWAQTGWIPLAGGGPSDIEVVWRGAASEAGLDLWVDGQRASLEVPGQTSNRALDGLFVGARFLVTGGEPVEHGGKLEVDDILLSY